MPFDFAAYLTLAEELKQRTDEASLRTAISRVYYAVFHQEINPTSNSSLRD